MKKGNELAHPESCLNKAAHNEPLFVLRAKDPLAPQAVRLWAAMSHDHHEAGKIKEALQLATDMEEWAMGQKAPVPACEEGPTAAYGRAPYAR